MKKRFIFLLILSSLSLPFICSSMIDVKDTKAKDLQVVMHEVDFYPLTPMPKRLEVKKEVCGYQVLCVC